MLRFLLYKTSYHHLANLFGYITIRCGLAAFLAFMLSVFLGGKIIRILKKYQRMGQPIRTDGPGSHMLKQGTPSMGGIIIILTSSIACLLFADWSNVAVVGSLVIFWLFGLLGFADDALKIVQNNHKGVSAKTKLAFQVTVAILAYFIARHVLGSEHSILYLPSYKKYYLDIGMLIIPFIVFLLAGSSNAVNLTDGLDGLAIVPFGMCASYFGVVAYLIGTKAYASYLHLPYIAGMSELSVVCAAMVGSSLGFLWFNSKPAEVFMGDTGSLALGGFLGIVSILTKQELALAVVGGVFVVETLSVILQVTYFKATGGKRILKMAPLHHHYEQIGISETKVVVRFWIASFILMVLSFIMLKVR